MIDAIRETVLRQWHHEEEVPQDDEEDGKEEKSDPPTSEWIWLPDYHRGKCQLASLAQLFEWVGSEK